MFRSQYDSHERRHAPSGSRFRVTKQLVIDPDGNRRLEVTGTEDVYERIQSFKDECTIENIVRRALNGDPYALSKAQGVYCDTTLLPTDLISAYEAISRAEAIYKALPAAKRQELGSFRDFLSKFGTLEGIQSLFAEDKKSNKKAAPAADPAPAVDPAPAADGGDK